LQSTEVTMADFDAALTESRASVTPETERDYEQMAARLKQDATAVQPIGFAFPVRAPEQPVGKEG
jgi:transitional endoplasmic reticulum ATPase